MMGLEPQIHPPGFIRKWFPGAVWTFNASENSVFLTFDDGPIPESTPWILDTLAKADAKATFFCVGENVFKYPGLYRDILAAGHSAGNHTYNHLQGLKTGNKAYFDNIRKASLLIGSNLFRPPHGLMKPSQFRHLAKFFRIVMWDIVSTDCNPASSPSDVFNHVVRYVKNGSVIVFHDSIKSVEKLKTILPQILDLLKDNGYQLCAIPAGLPAPAFMQTECCCGGKDPAYDRIPVSDNILYF